MEKIKYKNYYIKENIYKNNTIVYDVSYTIYDKNKRFITNYFNKTLEQVKKEIDLF